MNNNQPEALNWGLKDDVFLVLVVLGLPLIAAAVKVFGEQRVFGLVCRFKTHEWADEHRYGTQPACLRCGAERGER